ncbi:unnamed protein product [marine sediment metagenome]|uniref:Uncharacterized protein n=1 Tax=marine sediment metagenome TaxID=412755 RepID=X0UZD9_9ZZZZ
MEVDSSFFRTCRVSRLYRELTTSPIGAILGASPEIVAKFTQEIKFTHYTI